MTIAETEVTKLQAKRQELIKRLQDIEADYKRGLSADSEEQATELENAEVLAGIARAASAELEEIEKRIAEINE